MINRANVDRCNKEGNKQVSFIACEDIKQGEQLFVEYIDTRLDVEERRTQLAHRYGFLCVCPRCSAESGELEPGSDKNNENK